MKLAKWVVGGLGVLSVPAFAQSSVTLYGVIDTGIEYVTHANAAGDRLVRMPGITGELPSRWGLRGSEDLGGGLKTVFQLESGFNPRGGDLGQGGRLFGRQAWVGLQGPWGKLSFGRQYSMTFWGLTDSDILGPDIYGSASLDAYIPNARSDNAIAYMGTFRGLTLGAMYSFGRDSAGTGNSPGQGTCAGSVAGHFTQCRQWSAMIKYDTQTFGVSAAYDEQRGGAGAAANFFNGVAPLALTSEGDKDIRMQVSGYGNIGPVKLGAGWVGRHVDTVSPSVPDVRSDLFFVGAAYQVTPAAVLDGEAFRIVNREQNTRATMTTLRGTYFLSKATAAYLQGSYLWNSAHARYSLSSGGGGTTPAAGVGQLGVMAGIRHMF
ncbi:porin [Burkholderia multivorans]|uniref:porin n=1 Tax=Burkholderia multivorans TaxID=87883 RepID=UPI000277C774|nr:porin [Burkholderia multivorans]AVR22335.1 porin [Burkholderia multivorans]EJO60488.1 gram-negative porin domain protein [Burkholderia multivorans ATCC BAA-247]MBU9493999.1 porin [Burkholderia multivorans]MCO1435772.1 porin [Burkholderia multivorans]MDN7509805.1 porin [Burkholderia multivorans]